MDILDECRAHGVPNLYWVRPNVLRCGQPTAEGWDYLRTLLDGRRVTVLKLNFQDEGSDEPARVLGWDVVDLGIEPRTNPSDVVYAIKEVLEKPDQTMVARILEEARKIPADNDGRRWIIHCRNGHDRTGWVCGAIRMLVDRWTKAAAHAEMVQMGYHTELVGLERQWEEL